MSSHLPLSKAATIIAAVAVTALLAPSSVSAQQDPLFVYGEQSAVRTELVSFARLTLAKRSDQQRLQRKVSAAVARVCLRDIGRDGLQDRDYYACEDKAWKAASPQIAAAVARASNLASGGSAPIAATAIRVSAI